MPYKKEIHDECISLLQRFLIPIYYGEFLNYTTRSFEKKEDREHFVRLVYDCCILSIESCMHMKDALLQTYSHNSIISDKTAINKVKFLEKVMIQLWRIRDKKATPLLKYIKKHIKIEEEDLAMSFLTAKK
jgi:hypothetical protein